MLVCPLVASPQHTKTIPRAYTYTWLPTAYVINLGNEIVVKHANRHVSREKEHQLQSSMKGGPAGTRDVVAFCGLPSDPNKDKGSIVTILPRGYARDCAIEALDLEAVPDNPYLLVSRELEPKRSS